MDEVVRTPYLPKGSLPVSVEVNYLGHQGPARLQIGHYDVILFAFPGIGTRLSGAQSSLSRLLAYPWHDRCSRQLLFGWGSSGSPILVSFLRVPWIASTRYLASTGGFPTSASRVQGSVSRPQGRRS